MSNTPPTNPPSPWHDGERIVRRRAGVEEQMEPIGPRAVINVLPGRHRALYAELPYLVVGTVDESGNPWASLISGPPGFIRAPDQGHLEITGKLFAEDPASTGWIAGASVAMLGIELLTRRRIRANGLLRTVTETLAVLEIQQAFGNCPKYIQAREVTFSPESLSPRRRQATVVDGLDDESRRIIAAADTFFVASYTDRQGNPGRAVDVSHRGGKPGFVRVENDRLSIPDFSGNQYFNTLGNFVHNPRAGLLFVAFATGDLLHLTGDVVIDFDTPESRAFAGAERVWHVDVRRCVSRRGVLPLRFTAGELAPTSVTTGSWEAARSRLAVADRVDRWQPFRVTAIAQETRDIKSFSLARTDGGNLPPFAAGQHVPIRLALHACRAAEERLYTLSTAPGDHVKKDGVAAAMTAVLFDGAAMARRNLSTAAHLLQQMECRMWDLLRTFHRGARQLRDCRAKRLRIV
jgi:predicted pyridoxine 5'-phosphate oxidase superfamily flavin-nucleotide-binding protein